VSGAGAGGIPRRQARDRQNGVVFGTTPARVEYDAQVANEEQGSGFNLNRDGNWRVATTRLMATPACA
jgi:hypothetical protein